MIPQSTCNKLQSLYKNSQQFCTRIIVLIVAATLLLIQYINKQKHEKLYMQVQPHQIFNIMLALCYAISRGQLLKDLA